MRNPGQTRTLTSPTEGLSGSEGHSSTPGMQAAQTTSPSCHTTAKNASQFPTQSKLAGWKGVRPAWNSLSCAPRVSYPEADGEGQSCR